MEKPVIPTVGKRRLRPRDADCPILEPEGDCDDLGLDVLDTPEGADLVAHDCGLEYLGKWSLPEAED
jgi:hypothetical protein